MTTNEEKDKGISPTEFIKRALETFPKEIKTINFNLGIDFNMNISTGSHNRVQFTIVREEKVVQIKPKVKRKK